MIRISFLILTLTVTGWTGCRALAEDSASDDKWMAYCSANHKDEDIAPEVVHKYCACMADLGDVAEMLTLRQMELERSYPPMHLVCHRQAREQ